MNERNRGEDIMVFFGLALISAYAVWGLVKNRSPGLSIWWMVVLLCYICHYAHKHKREKERFYTAVQAVMADISARDQVKCDFGVAQTLIWACQEAERFRRRHRNEELPEGTRSLISNIYWGKSDEGAFEAAYNAYCTGQYREFAYICAGLQREERDSSVKSRMSDLTPIRTSLDQTHGKWEVALTVVFFVLLLLACCLFLRVEV